MNAIQFYEIMPIVVGEQRFSRREPIQLESPGILLRTVGSAVRNTIGMWEHVLAVATEEETYCKYNPEECFGAA